MFGFGIEGFRSCLDDFGLHQVGGEHAKLLEVLL